MRNKRNNKKKKQRRAIRVLPAKVIDQIAAGEVVQRPCSVVKELLENALDANPTRIVVQYDGLSGLSVSDNGNGIRRSDLELLCTRHATSKLVSIDDFSSLSTFGFRGEALASTSMVSRLVKVVSRWRGETDCNNNNNDDEDDACVNDIDGENDDNDDDNDDEKDDGNDDDENDEATQTAYSQSYQNGRPLHSQNPRPCARTFGTTIVVEDLFYNVPHRKAAYSKRESEEYGAIHGLVQDYAVHHPAVGFVCQRRMKTRTKSSAKQQQQLVIDCNTGQIPAVRALVESREAAAKARAKGLTSTSTTRCSSNSNSSNSDRGRSHKEKVVDATKQILSHVLESNLAKHLLYTECASEPGTSGKTVSDTVDGNSGTDNIKDNINGRNNNNNKNNNNNGNNNPGGGKKKPDADADADADRYRFRYAAEIYCTSPAYHNTIVRGGSGTKAKSKTKTQRSSKPARGKFILFLNHRLVDLPPLKRALEDVYADLGNTIATSTTATRGKSNTSNSNAVGKPVLVVNLTVPGCQVDVNVHPSKRRVALMHQEDLIRELTRAVRERLERDGQAFVAGSVASTTTTTTPSTAKSATTTTTTTTTTRPSSSTTTKMTMIGNPYAASANENAKSSKRKRPSDEDDDDDDLDNDDDDDDDENDATEEPSKKRPAHMDSPQRGNSRGKADQSNPSKPKSKTNATASSSTSTSTRNARVPPSKLIRTNAAARAGAIEPFLVSTQTLSQQSSQSSQWTTQSEDETKNDPSSTTSSLRSPLSQQQQQQHQQQQQSSIVHVPPCPLADPSPSGGNEKDNDIDLSQPGAFAAVLKRERCTCPTDSVDVARRTIFSPKTVTRPRRVVPTLSRYTSIATLRRRVGRQQCHETTARMRSAFYVGALSHQRSLLQCGEELVVIQHLELARELFYQLALARFGGGADTARLGGGGIRVRTVVAQALQCEDELARIDGNKSDNESEKDNESDNDNDDNTETKNDDDDDDDDAVLAGDGMLPVNESNRNLARHVAARLVESSAMLEEYFSIRIEVPRRRSRGGSPEARAGDEAGKNESSEKANDSDTGRDDGGNGSDTDQDDCEEAILTGLPVLLEGHAPQPHGLPIFLLRLATQVDWTREKHCFHGVCKELGNFYAALPSDPDESKTYVKHTLFPALSYLLLPSKNQAKNGNCAELTKLSTLYKVFER